MIFFKMIIEEPEMEKNMILIGKKQPEKKNGKNKLAE